MGKIETGISKIIIKIGGTEVSCTPEQIKDLKEALDRMYPPPAMPSKEYVPYPYPVYPSYPRPYRWDMPYITCLSAGSVSLSAT